MTLIMSQNCQLFGKRTDAKALAEIFADTLGYKDCQA